VLAVHRAVAWHIKGGETGGVFAELVAPETRVVLLEGDPVRVHVREEIVPTERLEERADIGAIVGRDKCAIGQTSGGVGRRNRVVLAVQVAVLCVGAVAEIGPARRALVGAGLGIW
jgi:hypothetical protein